MNKCTTVLFSGFGVCFLGIFFLRWQNKKKEREQLKVYEMVEKIIGIYLSLVILVLIYCKIWLILTQISMLVIQFSAGLFREFSELFYLT